MRILRKVLCLAGKYFLFFFFSIRWDYGSEWSSEINIDIIVLSLLENLPFIPCGFAQWRALHCHCIFCYRYTCGWVEPIGALVNVDSVSICGRGLGRRIAQRLASLQPTWTENRLHVSPHLDLCMCSVNILGNSIFFFHITKLNLWEEIITCNKG